MIKMKYPVGTGARIWHLWDILIPRRSITGKLIWGRVWRRHDGSRWIYKPFVEFDERLPERRLQSRR
jgi:hypothetical protein